MSNDDVIKYNIFEDAVGEIEYCGFLKISQHKITTKKIIKNISLIIR